MKHGPVLGTHVSKSGSQTQNLWQFHSECDFDMFSKILLAWLRILHSQRCAQNVGKMDHREECHGFVPLLLFLLPVLQDTTEPLEER